jgi:hypothetical protein
VPKLSIIYTTTLTINQIFSDESSIEIKTNNTPYHNNYKTETLQALKINHMLNLISESRIIYIALSINQQFINKSSSSIEIKINNMQNHNNNNY